MNLIKEKWIYTENNILAWFKDQIRYLIISLIFGLILYYMMMSHNLVNSVDGIWNTSNFIAGDWEISLGRGLWRYFDKLRFGIVSVPLNIAISIFIISIGNALVSDLFKTKNTIFKYVLNFVIISTPVTCIAMSYNYLAVNFSLGYFLASIAAVITCQKGRRTFLGGLFLGCSMASYQSYFGVTLFILLLFSIRLLMQEKKLKEIKIHLLKSILTIFSGGIFYLCITYLLLYRANTQLASYRGASEISLGKIFLNIPQSIFTCYNDFYNFFITNNMAMLSSKRLPLLLSIFILFCVMVGYWFIKLFKYSKLYSFIFLSLILFIPLACNGVTFLAVGNHVNLLMSTSMVLVIGLLYVFLPDGGILETLSKRFYFILICIFIWVASLTVCNDQLALLESKNATVTLAESIFDTLSGNGYFYEGMQVALVGRPAENDWIVYGKAYPLANGYAKFPAFSTSTENYYKTWNGVLSEYSGIRLPWCSYEEYEQIKLMNEVILMPEYPMAGSIKKIGNVIVVKISEVY